MVECYLTIDDSPSPHTDEMIDFLCEKDIPALLFCRGDFLDDNPNPIIRAIEKGFVVGNHSYDHKPAGDVSFDEMVHSIEKTEILIDAAYQKAGVHRPGKYFRFPYLDRGDGQRIERFFEDVSAQDLNADPRVQLLQNWLHTNGFAQPFEDVDHGAYANLSVAKAADCLMSFTSYDWMLTPRHKGNWEHKTIDDLKMRLDSSANQAERHVMIFHDQPEILPIFKSLIEHMTVTGYKFVFY